MIVRYQGTKPEYGSEGASCVDLKSTEFVIIPRGFHKTIKTGLRIQLEPGMEAQVRGRSGMAARGVLAPSGTIDSDYRGEIAVILFNLSNVDCIINIGDRIAQLAICNVLHPVWEDRPLDESSRGEGGFGSTGV